MDRALWQSGMPDSADDAAATLIQAVKRLARRLRRERAAHGVSPSKLTVLGHLLRDGPMTATDLAARDRIQPQSLTRIIAALEERGLIGRQQDEADRRQIRIALTEAGRALLAEDSRRQAEWLARAIGATLDPAERALLRAAAPLLERLAGMEH